MNGVSSVGMKLSWPIPFNKECINEDGCEGLKYNSGLFTQCKNKKEGDRYCKTCEEECSKNASGLPDNGCISDRMKCGLMEFRDPKGRKPSAFLSILKKKNISIEKVREDAKAMSIMIDEEHLTEEVKEKKEKIVKEKKEKGEKRGRPKKAPKEVETSGVVDLFAELVEEAVVNKTESEVVASEVVVEEKSKKKLLSKEVSAEEKELKKAEKETAKAAKKEAEKQAREEKRAAEKAAKAAAKAEAKKEKKPAKKDAKKEEKKAEEQVAKVEEPKAKVTVTRFEHEGKKYLKSTENILYDPVTKDELGIWCEESKTIKALPEEDDEEIEEEEYESDDE